MGSNDPDNEKNTVNKLHFLAGDETKQSSMDITEFRNRKFTLEKFTELHLMVTNFVDSTPAAGSTRNRREGTYIEDVEAVFEGFRGEVLEPFAKEMATNLELSLEVDPVCEAFGCLDVRNFPKSEADVDTFGEDDLETIIGWYGDAKKSVYPEDEEQSFTTDPVISSEETQVEYKS